MTIDEEVSGMIIGSCSITLRISAARSLKEKRRIIKSIIERIRNRYNVSISEVGYLESWQLAQLGIAFVSNNMVYIEQIMDNIISFIETCWEVELTAVDKEIV